jgi:lycopene cyclase domain-containing protein
MEEWLFFFTIPYSCIFVYVSLNYFLKKDPIRAFSKNISIGLIVLLLFVVLFNTEKLYTAIKLSLTVLMLLYIVLKNPSYMGRFYRAYLVCLIPFFIVNGLLTAIPVVTYNDTENLGIRIGTIPIEDTVYMLLMLLMNTTLFEYFKEKQKNVEPTGSY